MTAPARLRRDDVRRYCLRCSEATGRLVTRLAPSRERVRAEQAERKAQAKAAQRGVVAGIDLAEELNRLWILGIRCSYGAPHSMAVPTLTVRRQRKGLYATGHANTASHRIVVTVPDEPAQALAVLAQEVAHLLTPDAYHRQVYWIVLTELVETAYGVRPDFRATANLQQRKQRVVQAITEARG